MRECSSLQRLCACTLPRVMTVFSTLASTALPFFLAITASFRSVRYLAPLPCIQAAIPSPQWIAYSPVQPIALAGFRSKLSMHRTDGSGPSRLASSAGAGMQMAPYNTQYARLAAHMAHTGVTAEPNLWDHPVSLGREHRPATPDSDGSASAAARLRAPSSLLPPDRLLPLMVPFEGGPGPMCGGAALGAGSRWASIPVPRPISGLFEGPLQVPCVSHSAPGRCWRG